MGFRKLEAPSGGMYNSNPGASLPSTPTTDANVPIIPTSDSLPDTSWFFLEGSDKLDADRDMENAVGDVTPVRYICAPVAPNNLFNAYLRVVFSTSSNLSPLNWPGAAAALTNGCRLEMEIGAGPDLTVPLDGGFPLKDMKDLAGAFPAADDVPLTGAAALFTISCPIREIFGAPIIQNVDPATVRALVFTINDDLATDAASLTSMRVMTSGWKTPETP